MTNYNCAGFIAESIESVITQTVSSWELIICDDNSVDESAEIIRTYSKKDSRIQLIFNDISIRGSAHCRNLALKHATGEYVAFLDSDDIWYPEKLEKQIAFMRKGHIDICYMSYDVMRENGEKIHTIVPPERLGYTDMLKGKWMHTSTIALKRSIPIEFPALKVGQDIAMWLQLFRSGRYTAHGLLFPLSSYRLRGNSASARKLHTIGLHWKRIRHLEQTPLPQALYYFFCYATNMLKKYLRILPEVLRIR